MARGMTGLQYLARDALPSPGRVIVLNGCSSAGKSSLAIQLQRLLPEAYLHVQLDAFRAMEPCGYFGSEGRPQQALRLAALCRALHATVREYVLHGQNVLFDHVLDPQAWTYFLEDLTEFDVYLIKVDCPLPELQRRERLRGDRPIGLAASQWDSVHKDRDYDYVVHTGDHSAAESAQSMLEWFAQSPRAGAYVKMARRQSQAASR